MRVKLDGCPACQIDKDGKPYVKMSLRELVDNYPALVAACHLLELPIFPMLYADSKYLVRIKEDKLEIGYGEDAWEIG